MKLATLRVVTIAAIALTPPMGEALRAAPPASPRLDVPAGWRTEDTAYPPPWAKQLPWKGALQIRFPPGWFDAKSPFFWSYPVLYRLEGDVLSGRDDLEKALRAYDAGLYGGGFDPARIKIDVGKDRKADKRGHAAVRRSITIDGFDPFTTQEPLTTRLEVFRWYCPESKRTTVLILRTPRPFREDDPVWAALLPFWETFSCHPSGP